MNEKMNRERRRVYLTLHFSFFLLSFSAICSKLAAQSDRILSWNFAIFYTASVVIQMFFMYQWQQILKVIPLSIAYINRAVNLVWGMFWGYLIFGESIKPNMILGSMLVVLGLWIMMERSR